jgi:hypothetical protein
MKELIATAGLLLVVPMLASAQNADHQYRGQGYLFVGQATNDVTITAGFGGDGFVYKGLGLGAEVGYAAHDNGRGIGSANVSYHFLHTANHKVEPFVTGGYSLFFGDGVANGFNLGGGVNIWSSKCAALRLEVRGHPDSGDPFDGGSIVAFRIGVTFR